MKNKQIAVQDYGLINSKYKLTSSEIKFFLLAISKINDKDFNFDDEYDISLHEIKEAFVNEQNDAQIKSFAKKMMSKPLYVQLEDGDWEFYSFFTRVKYMKHSGIFKVQIHQDLKLYLLNLTKNFVITEIKYIMLMTSQYAIRMYQLLKQYQKLGGRDFLVDDLCNILQLSKTYSEKFNNFKKKILDVAVEQINANSDLEVSYTVKKLGRKVNEICFNIKTRIHNEKVDFNYENLPIEITALKGLNGFAYDDFYTQFEDGSFSLKKEDGTNIMFKSFKQFELWLKNPEIYKY